MIYCPYLAAYKNLYRDEYTIKIDVKNHALSLIKYDKIYKVYPVAVGKPSTPTPLGFWKIVKKGLWGEQFGGHFMQLNVSYGIYGIHGTDEPWSIGKSVSHGCVRMYSSDAAEVYNLTSIGTPVNIY